VEAPAAAVEAPDTVFAEVPAAAAEVPDTAAVEVTEVD